MSPGRDRSRTDRSESDRSRTDRSRTGGSRTDRLRRQRSAQRRAQRRQRSLLSAILLAVALLVAIGLLQGLHAVAGALEQGSTAAGFYTSRVVVVGVADHDGLDQTDRDILGEYPAQVGAVLTGGGCPASGWATLSAGRQVTIDCQPEVTDLGVVNDWQDREAEAAESGGELATLATSGQQCITAVGPGAAIGAARPDGTTAEYLDVAGFIQSDFQSSCAITFVDAGDRSDEVIRGVAALDDATVIVTGIGGGADAQLIYRTGTTLPGWLTSDSTDRAGVVTLADLSRTLQDVVAGGPLEESEVQGNPLEVIENSGVSVPRLTDHLTSVDTLVTPTYGPIGVLAAVAAAVALVGGLVWWRGGRHKVVRWAPYGLAVLAVSAPAGLLIAGVTGWWRSASPGPTAVGGALFGWLVVAALVTASWRVGPLARRGLGGWPVAVMISLAVCLADAAVGGYLHRSSLLAIRPMSHFAGFDGPTMGLLIASGAALLGVVVAGWRAPRWLRPDAAGTAEGVDKVAAATATDGTEVSGDTAFGDAASDGAGETSQKRRRPPLPFDLLWRPLVIAAIAIAVVLAVRWAAHPMTAADVLGFGIMVLWFLGAGVWLHRLGAPISPSSAPEPDPDSELRL